jgi:hypothetical protein
MDVVDREDHGARLSFGQPTTFHERAGDRESWRIGRSNGRRRRAQAPEE